MLIFNMRQVLGKNCFIREYLQSTLYFPIFFANICSRGSYKNVPLEMAISLISREQEKRAFLSPIK